MKAIKCPNCGSEQVKELTEEKYACMACDNVFLIHNHSKEFRKTDEHISSMHQDLKDDISKLMNSSNIDPDAIIEKAEQHLKKKDWDIAQCHLDKDCFIVRNSYTADKHFVYLLYFYLITLLT